MIKGRKAVIPSMIVPGSTQVREQAEAEAFDRERPVAERQRPAVAELGRAVELVVLLAVLDPDRAAGDRALQALDRLEPDAVSRERVGVARDAGEVVVLCLDVGRRAKHESWSG